MPYTDDIQSSPSNNCDNSRSWQGRSRGNLPLPPLNYAYCAKFVPSFTLHGVHQTIWALVPGMEANVPCTAPWMKTRFFLRNLHFPLWVTVPYLIALHQSCTGVAKGFYTTFCAFVSTWPNENTYHFRRPCIITIGGTNRSVGTFPTNRGRGLTLAVSKSQKRMSSHASDLAVYAKSSSSSPQLILWLCETKFWHRSVLLLHFYSRDVVSAVIATSTWLGGWLGDCLSATAGV